MTTNKSTAALANVAATLADCLGKVETLRQAVETLRATLPNGKYADKAAYTDARRILLDAGIGAGHSPAAVRIQITRSGFSTLNPDLKPRGRSGGKKKKTAGKAEKKSKTAAAAPVKLSPAEVELLDAYRRHDAAKLRSIADSVEADNAARRR